MRQHTRRTERRGVSQVRTPSNGGSRISQGIGTNPKVEGQPIIWSIYPLVGGGASTGEGCIKEDAPPPPPPWTEWHRLWKHYLPHTSYAGGNKESWGKGTTRPKYYYADPSLPSESWIENRLRSNSLMLNKIQILGDNISSRNWSPICAKIFHHWLKWFLWHINLIGQFFLLQPKPENGLEWSKLNIYNSFICFSWKCHFMPVMFTSQNAWNY